MTASLPPKDQKDEHSEQEAAQRRDEALKRALNTPHKPHKLPQKNKEGRETKGEVTNFIQLELLD